MLSLLVGTIVGVLTNLDKVLVALQIVQQAVKLLGGLARSLGLIDPEIKDSDLGDKALQAEDEGIVPGNYKSYTEYCRAIESFQVDPEKSKMYSEEQKLQKATQLYGGLICDTYHDFQNCLSDFGLLDKNSTGYFTPDRMEALAKYLNKDNLTVLGDIVRVLAGKETNHLAVDRAMDAMLQVEKSTNPKLTDREAMRSIIAAMK